MVIIIAVGVAVILLVLLITGTCTFILCMVRAGEYCIVFCTESDMVIVLQGEGKADTPLTVTGIMSLSNRNSRCNNFCGCLLLWDAYVHNSSPSPYEVCCSTAITNRRTKALEPDPPNVNECLYSEVSWIFAVLTYAQSGSKKEAR